jgi:hypothetical protein
MGCRFAGFLGLDHELMKLFHGLLCLSHLSIFSHFQYNMTYLSNGVGKAVMKSTRRIGNVAGFWAYTYLLARLKPIR